MSQWILRLIIYRIQFFSNEFRHGERLQECTDRGNRLDSIFFMHGGNLYMGRHKSIPTRADPSDARGMLLYKSMDKVEVYYF